MGTHVGEAVDSPANATFWPEWMYAIIRWCIANELGNVSDLLGIIITVFGFYITIIGVRRARNAAQAAQAAADNARRTIATIDALSSLSSAITLIESIKRFHREQQPILLQEKYIELSKTLSTIRHVLSGLAKEHETVIQDAVTTIVQIESKLSKALIERQAPEYASFEKNLSRHLNPLHVVLIELKTKASGG